MKRRGFTLIELLVVVSIIAVLVSILLPSLSKARNQAKAVMCMSNLKQLGLGLEYYLGTNGEKIPIPYISYEQNQHLLEYLRYQPTWYVLVGEQIGWNPQPQSGGESDNRLELSQRNVIHCPSVKDGEIPGVSDDWATPHYTASSRFNSTPKRTIKMQHVRPAQEHVFLVDAMPGKWMFNPSQFFGAGSPWYTDPRDFSVQFRHNSGVNELYFDSHVSRLSQSAWIQRGIDPLEPNF